MTKNKFWQIFLHWNENINTEVVMSPSWKKHNYLSIQHSVDFPQNGWLSRTSCRLNDKSSSYLFFPVDESFRTTQRFLVFVGFLDDDRSCGRTEPSSETRDTIRGFLSIISLGTDWIVSETRRVSVTMTDGSCYGYQRWGVIGQKLLFFIIDLKGFHTNQIIITCILY